MFKKNKIDTSGINYFEKIAKLISELAPIDNMNSILIGEDIYIRIPKLKFKFKNEVDKSIYLKIKNIIENFSGSLDWTLSFEENQDPRRYYIIKPKLFDNKNCYEGKRTEFFSNKKYDNVMFEVDIYGEEIYKDTCKKAINDIPLLTEYLSKALTDIKN